MSDFQPPAVGHLLLRNADVHAPSRQGVQDILVIAGKIAALGKNLEVSGIPELVDLDAQGLPVSPGLVDTLTHITGGGGEGGYSTRMPCMPVEDAWTSGVTTVTGALGTDAVHRTHADLLGHARFLQSHGISAYIYAGHYHLPIKTLTGSVQTDIAYIPDVIGVGEVAIADHRGSHPSVEELARLAAEVRVGAMLAGKKGVLSIHVGDHHSGLSTLHAAADRYPVKLSHFYPTHINRHEDLLQQGFTFAKGGGMIDFTATNNESLLAAGDIDSPIAIARALEAGVPLSQLTMSTDAYASLPEFDADGRFLRVDMGRLDSLANAIRRGCGEVGLTFSSLLQTATLNPANALGLWHKGRLTVGADADFIIWSKDLNVNATITRGLVRRELSV
ncbi:beta-aspartyl-peptidase [Salinispirillum marinum]|uniref:Isoaspartyl dipeptidase n=2 Tax=Saccharospirillaceae TaxID=255527 RepID=A0ABV8BF13_9GAMM